ncbi:MAG: hypothetical protein IJ646_05405 [Clostridia bacterium]|nr:hypothetical protein [Clostridia bacterium]
MNKRFKTVFIILIVLALVAGMLWFLQQTNLLVIIPKIHGSVTFHQGDDSQVYRFSAAGGEYGSYDWTVGPDELPISVYLFSRNNWHVIDMNFDVEQVETQWHITGTVNVKTYEPVTYDAYIPLSDPVKIMVDCFP